MRFGPIDKLIEILKSIRCGNAQATEWQGSQLTLRYSLIDYMINKLNKIAGDMDDFIY